MDKTSKDIFVLDGHDGAGKTTLATMLANKINAAYVRPFSGNIGEQLIRFAQEKKFAETSEWGMQVIQNIRDSYPNQSLVFDRHWMTVFTLVPQIYWRQWMPLPRTVLCWANISITLERLQTRSENKYSEDYHRYYLDVYKKIANQFDSYFLDTSFKNIEASLSELLVWSQTE